MTTSFIIPTYNRIMSLRGTLGTLAELDAHSDDFEVLVVDNGSSDGTREGAAAEFARWPDCNWRYIHEPMPGLLSGRHRGALDAHGEILAFLDDDVRVSRDWLTGCRQTFGDPDVMLMGGPSRPLFEIDPPDWLSEFWWDTDSGTACGFLSLLDDGDDTHTIDPGMVWGLNFTIRKDALFRLGGFNPDSIPTYLQRYQGDGETGLSRRVATAGAKTVYQPAAAVQHEVPATRLAPAYLEQRGFFQGVADSYSKIRNPSTGDSSSVAELAVARRSVLIRRAITAYRRANAKPLHALPGAAWRWASRRVQAMGARVPAPQALQSRTKSALAERVAAAYDAGFAFHQSWVEQDPTVLAWARRPDYWDYALPESWKRLQPSAAAAQNDSIYRPVALAE